LTVTVFALYSLGLTILLLLASPNGGRPAQISSGVSTVLSFGTAIACYMALRRPYLEWRIANPSARSSSWLTAVGTSLVYTFAISFAVAVVRLLIALVAYVFNWNVGQL
jgi:NADH:ubiquinone oxidoreductase subunit 6 (subunit J)